MTGTVSTGDQEAQRLREPERGSESAHFEGLILGPQGRSKEHKRTCILVLGMHRSGTSALTRVLSLLGAALPKNLMGASLGNETGHWEPEYLVQLHDEMLAEAGSSWDDCRKFDFGNLPEDRQRHYRAEIRRIIENEYGDASLFVLKDPRICRFPALYCSILEGMGVDVRCVIAVRHPRAVCMSLRARKEIDVGWAQLCWLRHILDAEAATRNVPRAVVSYESLLDDWAAAVNEVAARLDLKYPRQVEEASPQIVSFLRRELNHLGAGSGTLVEWPELLDWIERGYAAIQMCSLAEVEAVAELDILSAVFEPISGVFDSIIKSERMLKEQVLVAKDAALAERDESIDALCTRAESLSLDVVRLTRLYYSGAIWRRIAFHRGGRPRGWLRLLLLDRKLGMVRPCARRILLKKNGRIRPIFEAWYAARLT